MLQSFTPSLLPAYAAALLFGYLCGSIPFERPRINNHQVDLREAKAKARQP